MNKKQFLLLNILLSSNILILAGIVFAWYFILFGGLFCFIIEADRLYWTIIYSIILFYLLYIFIKICFLFIFSLNIFKKTFSYKFLRKLLLNYRFRVKILFKIFIMDVIFHFILLNILMYCSFLNPKHNWTIEFDFIKSLKLFIFTGAGGIFFSYLIYAAVYDLTTFIKNIVLKKERSI